MNDERCAFCGCCLHGQHHSAECVDKKHDDPLAHFILNLGEREVNTFTAQVIMDYEPDSRACEDTQFTTDRRLSHNIEDRMAELNHGGVYSLALEDIIEQGLDDNGMKVWAARSIRYWGIIRVTNRQRILAAARAMSLEAPA